MEPISPIFGLILSSFWSLWLIIIFYFYLSHIPDQNFICCCVQYSTSHPIPILPDVIILKTLWGEQIYIEKLINLKFYLQHFLHPEHKFLWNNKPVSSWCLSHPHLSTQSARSVSASIITFQPVVWSFEVDFNPYSCA